MKHWKEPTEGGDAALIAAVGTITDPQEMLECIVAYANYLGNDPYYAHLNSAMWRAAARVATTPPPATGWVITANDSVEAICLGTEAEAEVVCARLRAEDDEKRRRAYGDQKHGRQIAVGDMDEAHVRNALRMILRKDRLRREAAEAHDDQALDRLAYIATRGRDEWGDA